MLIVSSTRSFLRSACAVFLLSVALAKGDVIISEFAAGNRKGLRDETGTAQDWIELWNRGTNEVDLLDWSLTDDRSKLEKWTFPSIRLKPGQFLVVFCSGKDRRASTGSNRLHTSFKLDVSGEYLALFQPGSPRLAASEFAPKYPAQRADFSYGLDRSNRWSYYGKPTPGAANGPGGIEAIAPGPQFSVERGLLDAPFQLSMSAPLEGATIRYTTDGSEPTLTRGRAYEGPLRITNTTIVRATTFKSGYLPATTQTQSYIFLNQVIHQTNRPLGFPTDWGKNPGFPEGHTPADYEMDSDPLRVNPNNPASPIAPAKLQRFDAGLRELPLVSIVMEMGDMFGPGGLYPSATESDPKPSNEKPCSVEMILPGGKPGFAVASGIDLHGNASRNPMKNPKHGFKLDFKGDFGGGALKFQLFADSTAKSFDDLILRPEFNVSWRHWSDTFGNAFGSLQRTRATLIRDPWLKETFHDMGQVASHSQFCHLFINGLYWGVYDLTEQPSDRFAKDYFGGKESDYDVIEHGEVKKGTAAAYNSMLGIAGLENNANYEKLKTLLDIPEFIDYMLLHFFGGHQDWGQNKNWYAIRKRTGPDTTFKYLPWDGENVLLDEESDRVSDSNVPSGLHTKLIKNAEYRLAFADRVFKQMLAPGGALTPAANIARWQKWQAILDAPIVAESMRWGDYRRDVHRFAEGPFVLYTRENQWLAENDRVTKSYLANRGNIVLQQLRKAGLYPALDAPSFNPPGGKLAAGFKLAMTARSGTIYYTTNGTDPRAPGTGEISPAAIQYAGAALSLTQATTIKARVRNGSTWSALNEASFTAGP